MTVHLKKFSHSFNPSNFRLLSNDNVGLRKGVDQGLGVDSYPYKGMTNVVMIFSLANAAVLPTLIRLSL